MATRYLIQRRDLNSGRRISEWVVNLYDGDRPRLPGSVPASRYAFLESRGPFKTSDRAELEVMTNGSAWVPVI
jgi:hypothetical protein